MEIRDIEKVDLSACAEVFCSAFNGPPWGEMWEITLAHQRLLHFFDSKGFIGICAEQDGKIVGFLLGNQEPFYFGPIYYLREMCTEPAYQGKGIGRRLLERLDQSLAEQGIASSYLMTDKGIAASKFYERNGYTVNKDIGFFAKRVIV